MIDRRESSISKINSAVVMTKTLPCSLWLDLLGKPYRAGGRGPDAYDCVGLMLELERRLGRTLPPWGSHGRNLAAALAYWEPVDDPAPGDGILLESDDTPWHIGVVCAEGWMLHAHASCGVVKERYNAWPWQNRIRGFYRARRNDQPARS